MTVIIIHNPRCSKSRRALEILESKGVPLTVVKYLDNPLSENELKDLQKKLGLEPQKWLRSKEAKWKELNIDPSDSAKVTAAMAANPILIERPIVVVDQKAVVARPPEKLEELF